MNWTGLRLINVVPESSSGGHNAVQQLEHMSANAFVASILGDVHAVVPLADIRRPDGGHGLVAQNRVQIVAQILLVLFLGGLLDRLVVRLAALLHRVGRIIAEQHLAACVGIVHDFRWSPCIQVDQSFASLSHASAWAS